MLMLSMDIQYNYKAKNVTWIKYKIALDAL